tara:strand:+ start:849 stop:1085 length:237 start_codon:yes stop_codon:yes gene_type:complete
MTYPNTEEELAEAWAMRVTNDWWDSLPHFAYRGLSMHDSTRLRIIVEKAINNALSGEKPPFIDEVHLPTKHGEHWWQK